MTEQEKIDLEENDRTGKSKFWKGVLAGSLVTAFAGLTVVGMAAGIWVMGRRVNVNQNPQTQENQQNAQQETGAQSAEGSGNTKKGLDISKIGPKLQYMERLVDQYYLFDEKETEEKNGKAVDPEEWIYSGYIYSLKDPYSVYYTAEEFEKVQESSNGSYCGIGVQVSQNVYTGIITVVKVFRGSPAEKAGMLPGDLLTAVGDIDATGMDLSLLVSDHIKGEEGTDVTLTVYRESIDDEVELTMKRAIVENPTVEYDMLENKIGYISLSSFEEVSAHQFKTAVDDLNGKGARGLIVDLRNNGGGVVTAAESIADYLLPDGKTVVSFKGKGVKDSSYVSKDEHQVDIPLVVLVNGESASASEVLTGALKDNNWATIVGTKTFGKGIAQGIFKIPDGSALKLTTTYYYVPSGECIHEIGIEPDVEVELDESVKNKIDIPKEEDNQLKAAVEVLLKGADAVNRQIRESLAAEETEQE